jgi:hypothetical protein
MLGSELMNATLDRVLDSLTNPEIELQPKGFVCEFGPIRQDAHINGKTRRNSQITVRSTGVEMKVHA